VLDPALAEHCAIVGVGGSLSLAAGVALLVVPIPRGLELAVAVGTMLFFVWTLYLMVRFTIAFGKAWRASRDAWDAADAASSEI
jgi:hypothetical protein